MRPPPAFKPSSLPGDTHPVIPAYQNFDAYQSEGGYRSLRACLDGTLKPEEVIAALSDSGLRGLGGAGFPTGRKWGLVRAEKGPRLMAVNGDEGEPGTFKDRVYLESKPHPFIEGMLIAAWAVEATDVYLYMRDEYPAVLEILHTELANVAAAGLSPHTRVHVRRGAGAYICGEESAMIESIEGKRGLPRHRPPYVAQVGLFGRPTLVNNIETLYWVPQILDKGAAWFEALGEGKGKGVRSYSVSGRVAKPGVVLAPAGSTALELIAKCGGMLPGHTLKGYLPGGASGGILPASMANLPLDFGQLEKYGSFVGSHAVVILSDKDNMRDVALNLMRFFEDESCGQCTPCRNGTEKAVQLMQAAKWDQPLAWRIWRKSWATPRSAVSDKPRPIPCARSSSIFRKIWGRPSLRALHPVLAALRIEFELGQLLHVDVTGHRHVRVARTCCLGRHGLLGAPAQLGLGGLQ